MKKVYIFGISIVIAAWGLSFYLFNHIGKFKGTIYRDTLTNFHPIIEHSEIPKP